MSRQTSVRYLLDLPYKTMALIRQLAEENNVRPGEVILTFVAQSLMDMGYKVEQTALTVGSKNDKGVAINPRKLERDA